MVNLLSRAWRKRYTERSMGRIGQADIWQRGRLAVAKTLRLDLTHAQTRYASILESYVSPGIKWLEIGCGRRIVPDWAMPMDEQERMASAPSLLVGVDVDKAIQEHPLLRDRVMALGGNLPFAPNSFDLVTANMVVEHLSEPEPFLADIHRVLRPGGRFLFHTTNYSYYLAILASLTPDVMKKQIVFLLEGRKEEDVFPTRYKINTRREINRLAGRSQFAVERLMVTGSSGSFARLGPVAWLECLVLKLVSTIDGGNLNSNIIAVLRR